MSISGEKIFGRKIVNQSFDLSEVEIERTEFDNCALAQFEDSTYRAVVRNSSLRRCKVKNCSIHGVRFEDVLVEDLSISRLMHLEACVFHHVILKGKIGPFMATPPSYALPPDVQKAFRAAGASFYEGVDWAIDISEAQFSDVDIYMIPGELVRRDPETQFLLRRSSFSDVSRDELPLDARIHMDRFEVSPYDSIVAVAPKRSKNFGEIHEALSSLRNQGLAE
jgi:hypothetical protein